MVNRQSPALIFVYDGKGRTRYCSVAFQTRDETLREQGLAAAQVAFESQHGTGNKVLRKAPRDCFRFSVAVGNERSHGAVCDLRFAICDGGKQFPSGVVSEIFVATFASPWFCRAAKWRTGARSPRLPKSRCQ